jgi:epoxyqueuosine reductase
MALTSKAIKEFAASIGAGDVGIANIERFANAPRRMHPSNIFPECKSVITVVQPFTRGSYRGITEGTHWANYTFYSYNRLNTLFREAITYKLSCHIEDHGWEAVPVYPGVPERSGMRPPVKEGRPAPEINMQVRISGVACGVGEMGWAKVFIHRKYGPRVRLGTILTDLELEPDPLLEPRTYCNECMKCAKDCPGGAIPRKGDRPPIRIEIEDKVYEWGDVHMGRCTLTHHGLNQEISPFLKKSVPGWNLDVRDSTMSEEAAYKMTYPAAGAHWPASPEFPSDAVIPFYNQIKTHTDYFAVCGARGCIRSCMEGLEKRKVIEQSDFKVPVYPRGIWEMHPPVDDESGGIAEGKFREEYNDPDPAAGQWK